MEAGREAERRWESTENTRSGPVADEQKPEVAGRSILDDFLNYPLTDIGSSKLYADMFKNELCYVRERSVYFYYNGKVWIKDTGGIFARRMAKKFAIETVKKALQLPDEETRKAYIKYYNRFNSYNAREKLVKDAQTVYLVDYSEFDKNPHLYNCQNGTFNLKTAVLQPHNAKDMLTQISNVEYHAEATCDRWEQFINEITQEDEASANLLQQIAGYCLGGSTQFECFFMLYGKTTRNGKGTFNSTMMKMHGDYAKVLAPESLAIKKFQSNSEAPNDSIASLAGARYVCVSEPGESLVLNSDLVKTLTGGDPIKARHLYEHSFTYIPQFKIVINTNFLPTVLDDTIFASNRLVLLNFNRHFDVNSRDISLKSFFIKPENLSGIFNWCYEGYRKLHDVKMLEMPEKSKDLFDKYRSESDITKQFITEVLQPVPGERLKLKAVYDKYKEWAADNGFKQYSRNTFKQKMEKHVQIEEYNHQKQIFGYMFKVEKPFDVDSL